MRWVIARVLPVPAPASTRTGPRRAEATARCSGSSASSSWSGPGIWEQSPAMVGWNLRLGGPQRRREEGQDFVSTPAVTMSSTSWCGYCHRLRGQMDREGITYEVVDIEHVPDA